MQSVRSVTVIALPVRRYGAEVVGRCDSSKGGKSNAVYMECMAKGIRKRTQDKQTVERISVGPSSGQGCTLQSQSQREPEYR